MAQGERYVLLDARGLALHAYHRGTDPDGGLDSKGKKVNGAGWALEQMFDLCPIFDSVPPRRIIACWDGGNDYRMQLWPGYKAKRRAAKEDKAPEQSKAEGELFRTMRSFYDGLGITQVVCDGVEADDVIAYLCTKLPNSYVYTRDADLLQLPSLAPGTEVMMHNKVDGMTTIEGEHKDIPLPLIRLYKSLVGDSSDEYPGVVGVGDVKFRKLLAAYGEDGMLQLDEIVQGQNWRELGEVCAAAQDPVLNAIHEQREAWYRQHLLATLTPSLCEGVRLNQIVKLRWRRRVPSYGELSMLKNQLGLPNLLERFKHWLPKIELADNSPDGIKALQHFQEHITDAPVLPFDYESWDPVRHQPFQEAKTKGEYVDVLSQRITGVSFAYGNNFQHSIYMPCEHKDTANWEMGNIAWAVALGQEKSTLVAHNAPFEYNLTATNLGFPLNRVYDTRLMSAHIQEEESHHLKDLSKQWLEYCQATYAETLEAADAANMSEISGEDVLSYGCDDSIVAGHLFDLFYLISTIEGTYDFLVDKEFEFVHEQSRGFLAGTKLDLGVIKQLDVEAEETHKQSREKMVSLLTEHCAEVNEEGATNLYTELETYAKAKMAEDGKTHDEIEEYLDNLWEATVQGSQYVPYFENREPGKPWVPTPTKLTQVAKELGFPDPITKATKKGVTEWVVAADALLNDPESASEIADPDKAEKFLELMAEAAHLFKKREGTEYEVFKTFCLEIVGEPGDKVTTGGDELNFGSPKQMQQLFYAKLGLPIKVRSKVATNSTRDRLKLPGSASTDDDAVRAARADDVESGDWKDQVLENFSAAKEAQTARSLFYAKLPLWVHPLDDVTHPSILNCGTETHRPSASAFNILQITKGPLRRAFLPREDDHVLIAADFNGQELRITASESLDPAMLDAYIGEDKKDIHSMTAASIAPAFFANQVFRNKYDLPDEYQGLREISYDDYRTALADAELGKAMSAIRGAAKACIAEGSPVLTDRGLVPIEQVLLTDKVWDGVEWVTHEGVIYKGEREVIEYEGLTATADHRVYTEDGRSLPIGDCAGKPTRPSLAVTEIDGRPVRYQGGGGGGILETSGEWGQDNSVREVPLHGVRETGRSEREQRPTGVEQNLRVPAEEIQGREGAAVEREVQRPASAMHQPEVEVLQELRGTGDRGSVPIEGALHRVGDGEPSTQELPGGAVGPGGQRRALRAGESQTGNSQRKSEQYPAEQAGEIQGCVNAVGTSMALDQGRPSEVPPVRENCYETGEEGGVTGGHSNPPSSNTRRAKVYDIVNAGPRHRFTVSGRLVANCNFLIIYGGNYKTLARKLLIKSEVAKSVMNLVFDRYSGLKPWQQRTIEFARRHGYVQTAYRTRRHMPKGILSSNDTVRMGIERQAVNAVIQQGAADILKEVMSTAWRTKLYEDTGAHMIAPIYDELLSSVPRANVWEFCRRLKEVMEVTPPGHKVPMVAEFKVCANNWWDGVEVGANISEEKIMLALEESERITA